MTSQRRKQSSQKGKASSSQAGRARSPRISDTLDTPSTRETDELARSNNSLQKRKRVDADRSLTDDENGSDSADHVSQTRRETPPPRKKQKPATTVPTNASAPSQAQPRNQTQQPRSDARPSQSQQRSHQPQTQQRAQPSKPQPHPISKPLPSQAPTKQIPSSQARTKRPESDKQASHTTLPVSDNPNTSHTGNGEQSGNHNESHKDKKVVYTVDEVVKFGELEMVARQIFISSRLNVDSYEEVVNTVFRGMSSTHYVFKEAIKKCKTNFANWKSRTMSAAETWVNKLVDIDESGHDLKNDFVFRSFAAKLNEMYVPQWACEIFTFMKGWVNPSRCTEQGKAFIKYAFVLLATSARMAFLLNEDPRLEQLTKYTRDYSLKLFNGICRKASFAGLKSTDFPLNKTRAKLTTTSYVNLDEDSDGEILDLAEIDMIKSKTVNTKHREVYDIDKVLESPVDDRHDSSNTVGHGVSNSDEDDLVSISSNGGSEDEQDEYEEMHEEEGGDDDENE